MQELATRGAQIILLTHHAPSDPFLVDYIEDLRTVTNNELIYAEQVDLSSLHSIRLFATKWVDNAPPRRLDMIILCANVMTPYFGTGQKTKDGLEAEWMINYLSTFHLLSILSPAIRAQPPDRDVRILFSTCSSYIGYTERISFWVIVGFRNSIIWPLRRCAYERRDFDQLISLFDFSSTQE